jgi:acetyltransferase-like isoleucine patch superfamily enzyme
MEGFDVRLDKTAMVKHLVCTGDHVSIDMCVYCSVRLSVGSWVHIAPHVSIIGGYKSSLKIGDFAGISTGARIVCGSEDFVNSLLGFIPEEFRTVIYGNNVIEDFAWVGAGAIVLPDITIAKGSVIGAGAVVTKSTKPWMVYAGNPARIIKKRNEKKIMEDYNRMISNECNA